MPEYDDDDVEVVYDVPYASQSNSKQSKGRGKNGSGGRSNPNNHSGGSSGVIGNYVDFENVFDPFERDQDDVAEFFDEEDPSQDNTLEQWEKPNMFDDPRKVR